MARVLQLSELAAYSSGRSKFASVEEEQDFEKAKAELNKEARENWDDESWHKEQARVIAETLDWGFKHDTTFNTYFPSQFVKKDEQIVLRERRGLRVFWTHRAGEIDESQLDSEVYELRKDSLGWHLREFEDNVEVDYAETIADLMGLAADREEAEVNRRIFGTLQAAIGVSSPYYESGAFDESVLRNAITEIEDTPVPSNARLVRGVTIVGRRRAVQQILDFDSFNDTTKDSIARTGQLGTYFGARVVAIDNYTDEEGIPYIPSDELWVLGGAVGRFVAYGGSKIKTWDEHTVDYRHYKSRRDVGVTVTHPEVARRIVLSSASS